jgi:GNAT superfamily N-acetyltransferase
MASLHFPLKVMYGVTIVFLPFSYYTTKISDIPMVFLMKKKQFELIGLNKNNLPVVLEIARDIIQNNYSSFLDKSMIDNYIKSGLSDKEIIDNMDNCWVIQNDKDCIGFSILLNNKIHLMMINRKYQKQKYGTSLLNIMEDRLFEKYETIELQSFAENTIANNFYEKHHWNKISIKDNGGLVFYQYQKTKRNHNNSVRNRNCLNSGLVTF